MINTRLKDDYGTPINDGDTIEWTYDAHGILSKDENGKEIFNRCFSGGEMTVREFKEKQVVKYEVRGDVAGYFLDRPSGMSLTFIKDKPKCKVVNAR